MAVRNLPTHFGALSFSYRPKDGRGELSLDATAAPPGGFVIALPKAPVRVEADGSAIIPAQDGRVTVPAGTKRVVVEMTQLAQKSSDERKDVRRTQYQD
jgi:hypothetical protein